MPYPIVDEEQRLLARVRALLAEHPEPAAPSEEPIVRELTRIRESLLTGADRKDAAAQSQQWHRQNALLRQLRSARGPSPSLRCVMVRVTLSLSPPTSPL